VRLVRIKPSQRRVGIILACSVTAFVVCLAMRGAPASADLNSQLSQTQAQIAANKAKAGVLSSTISRLSNRVRSLTQQVATLRDREAAVQDQLAQKEAELATAKAELKQAQARLAELRAKLARAIVVLEKRLVAIYEAGTPDALTVILSADGFDDLVDRTEYLNLIQEGDSNLVNHVRTLRNETQQTVDHLTVVEERIHKARDVIAAQRAALARTRSSLQAQEGALAAARNSKQSALSAVNRQTDALEKNLADIQGQLLTQLGAGYGPTLPAGPIRGAGSGFIWPVNGPVVSGFGWRFGGAEFHRGIDIAVPTGTPIRAAKGGLVVQAGPYDGYGNFTCINHGGGLSTCYAHQERFAVASGQTVSQGQVIGYSDCTGYCFGPHVHFEVRINGTAVDPMGYL
jgi:murein DD-endopeptidase MepM/ murein hydrolase activator NlpD